MDEDEKTGAIKGKASIKIGRIEGGQPAPKFQGKQADSFPVGGMGVSQQPDGSYRVIDKDVYNNKGGKALLEKTHKSFYPTRAADIYDDEDIPQKSKGFRYVPEMMPDYKKEQVETFNPRFKVVCANGACTATNRGNTMPVDLQANPMSASQFQANNNNGRVGNKLDYDLDGKGGGQFINNQGHEGIKLIDNSEMPTFNANVLQKSGSNSSNPDNLKGTGGVQDQGNSLFKKVMQNLNSVQAGEGIDDRLRNDYESGRISKEGLTKMISEKMKGGAPSDLFSQVEREVPTGGFSPRSGVNEFSYDDSMNKSKQESVRNKLEKLSLEELIGNASKKKQSKIQINP